MLLEGTIFDFFTQAVEFFNDAGRWFTGITDYIAATFREIVFFITTFLELIPNFSLYTSWLPRTGALMVVTILEVAVLYRLLGLGD